jgi:hypothetical protein
LQPGTTRHLISGLQQRVELICTKFSKNNCTKKNWALALAPAMLSAGRGACSAAELMLSAAADRNMIATTRY